MKKLVVGGIAVLALISTGPGWAADLAVYKAPPIAAPLTWTGCYVGVAGGGGSSRSRHINSTGADITPWFTGNGGVFGGEWGCNYQMAGRWVLGVEGDLSWTGLRGSTNNLAAFNAAVISRTNEKWLSTSRVRTGMAFNNWLVYATYGLALGDVEINMTLPGGAFASESHVRVGWTVGAGVETKVTPAWSVKAEYLYVNFDWRNYFTPAPAGFADRGGGVPVTNHIFRVGANYHLGWGR